MRQTNALQDLNSKVSENICKPAFIEGTSEKNDRLRILYVDDNRIAVEISKQILTMENNFEIETASSVAEAFQKLEKQSFDAIISDYEMPQKNGLDFLKELRAQQKDIPFILFTGKGREEVVVTALNLGADSYIYKNGLPETVYCELADAINKTVKQRKAEASLIESEEKFRKVFAIGHDAFLISTLKESTIVDVNERFAEMFGFSKQEVIGKSAIDLGLWANLFDREKITNDLRSERKLENLEISCRRKSGELFHVLLSVSLLEASNQQLLLSTAKDLSGSKNTENALKESEEKFRHLAEESPNIIFIIKQSRVVYANKKSEEITGYTRDELYSPNFDFHLLSPPEYVELVRSTFYRHLKGEIVAPYEYELISKEGKKFDVVVTSKMIEYDCEKAILGIITDISELKKTEDALKRTMKELVNVNEKLSVVGNLTRHDVRNKLSVINGNIYILKKKNPDNPEIINRLSDMEQACKSITKIFDFAKMYEQIGIGELTLTDVEKSLDEAVALFSSSPNVKIINECHGLTVLADSFLRQLYYNLIDNSMKHGKQVTKIRVHYEIASQGQLNLIYEDNGAGVPIKNKPELFREGFSTGGSGYGLYLIRKMMEAYGWTIQENGEPEAGAKFTITIPKLSKLGKENYTIAP
jgi:PAS domain S-box-containing protein